jgi:hypothetical protein
MDAASEVPRSARADGRSRPDDIGRGCQTSAGRVPWCRLVSDDQANRLRQGQISFYRATLKPRFVWLSGTFGV